MLLKISGGLTPVSKVCFALACKRLLGVMFDGPAVTIPSRKDHHRWLWSNTWQWRRSNQLTIGTCYGMEGLMRRLGPPTYAVPRDDQGHPVPGAVALCCGCYLYQSTRRADWSDKLRADEFDRSAVAAWGGEQFIELVLTPEHHLPATAGCQFWCPKCRIEKVWEVYRADKAASQSRTERAREAAAAKSKEVARQRRQEAASQSIQAQAASLAQVEMAHWTLEDIITLFAGLRG